VDLACESLAGALPEGLIRQVAPAYIEEMLVQFRR
jgi:hypothetical protein